MGLLECLLGVVVECAVCISCSMTLTCLAISEPIPGQYIVTLAMCCIFAYHDVHHVAQ